MINQFRLWLLYRRLTRLACHQASLTIHSTNIMNHVVKFKPWRHILFLWHHKILEIREEYREERKLKIENFAKMIWTVQQQQRKAYKTAIIDNGRKKTIIWSSSRICNINKLIFRKRIINNKDLNSLKPTNFATITKIDTRRIINEILTTKIKRI